MHLTLQLPIDRLFCVSTNARLTEEMGGANWVGMAVAMMNAVTLLYNADPSWFGLGGH